MIFRKYSYVIDEKLKEYIKKLNDNYMNRYKMNNYNYNLIKDELNNNNLSNVRDLIINTNYHSISRSSLLFTLMGISFFAGYQFRGLSQ
jgi:FMN-dependent NADH-azoreductase